MGNKLVKYLFFLGSFIFAVNMSVSTTYAATEFTDISNSFAKDAIQELVEAGILNGVGDGQFNPTGEITRQDFAVILAKALDLDVTEAPTNPTFSDVPASHYSYNYVEAAVKAELVAGVGNGAFGLNANLTRQDMAVLFVRALGAETGAETAGYGNQLTFVDADSIASYAKDAVGFIVEAGLMSGIPGNSFNPIGTADRQQVALVASKFIKTVEDNKKPDEDQKPPEDNPNPPVDPSPNPNPNEDPPKEDPPKEDPPKEDPPNQDPPKEDPPNQDPPNQDNPNQ